MTGIVIFHTGSNLLMMNLSGGGKIGGSSRAGWELAPERVCQFKFDFEEARNTLFAVRQKEGTEPLPLPFSLDREPRPDAKVAPLQSYAHPQMMEAHSLNGETHLWRVNIVDLVRMEMLLLAHRNGVSHRDAGAPGLIHHPQGEGHVIPS